MIKKYTRILIIISIYVVILHPALVFAGPLSETYELVEYGFGSGGTASSSSESFSLLGTIGEVDVGSPSSETYNLRAGLVFTHMTNVPLSPDFTNPSNYYNKLNIVIRTAGNPSDTLYAVAISPDAFGTTIQYVQSDNTLGSTLGVEDWRSYSDWGSATGATIIGLTPGTTYTVKVAAKQGNFTQSGWGPTASAATTDATLSFDIDLSPSDTETAPPYVMLVGEIPPSSVITSNDKVWVDVSTNGASGADVYIYGTNNGLLSSNTGHNISSVSNNLASISEGYGAKSNSVTQSSGGPMEALSPYNGSGDNVGILDTSKRIIFDSSSLPVTNGRASFVIKAKVSAVTEASGDYTDTLTVIAAGKF